MKYLIGLIALLIPTYLVRFDIIGGIPTTLLELIIYAVFLYGLFNLGYCQWLKVKRRVWLPIGLLLLGLLIGFYVSPEKTTALGQIKAFFIDPLLVFWLAICYLEIKDFTWVIYGLAGSSLIVSGYTIVERILGKVTADGRVVGIFGYSPNYVSLFLAPVSVLLASYAISLSRKKLAKAIIFGAVFLINLSAMIFSGSRSGYLALAAGIIIYLIFHFWDKIRKKKSYKTALAILGLLAILGTGYAFRPNFNATSGRITSSNNLRWQIWQASLELGKKHALWGVGLGNFQNAFADLTKDRGNFKEFIIPMALTPHNIFLMFWLSTGLAGLIAFIWLLVTFYRTGFENFKEPWAKILLASMSALILQGLVDAAYFKNDLSLIFWLFFSYMILIDKGTQNSR